MVRQVGILVVGTVMLFCGAYVLALLVGGLLSLDIMSVALLFPVLAVVALVLVVLGWLKTYLERIVKALEETEQRVERIESALEKIAR
jgi:membrane protein implicated in regulation of membrane protease activity